VKRFPLKIEFTYYPPDKGRWDWINLIQNVCDIMSHINFIPDDDSKHLVPVFNKDFIVDKLNPRLIMKIL